MFEQAMSRLQRKLPYCFRRSTLLFVLIVFFVIGYILNVSSYDFFSWTVSSQQRVINYIAKYVDVQVTAGDDLAKGFLTVTLTNTGSTDIEYGSWAIYFYTILSVITGKFGVFEVRLINEGLYCIVPVSGKFQHLLSGESVTFDIRLDGWKSSTKSDHFPNWYVASDDQTTEPKILKCTSDESLSFVSSYDTPHQWKQNPADIYNPYTPEERYRMYNSSKSRKEVDKIHSIIPTVLHVESSDTNTNTKLDRTWVVGKYSDLHQRSWSRYLAKKLRLYEVRNLPSEKYIEFRQYKDFAFEEYRLDISAEAKKIVVISSSEVGAFYASQTILSLLSDSPIIPSCVIHDFPRFKYRGLLIDVAANYFPKETMFRLIDTMAQYKMNKLHLHLTGNEGWRIEIPSLPELTEYGSRRCHKFTSMKCLPPSIGSGPKTPSEFYSVSEFKDLLRYAKEKYIKVIPEFDVPGHSRAAILAMKYKNERSYLLTDHQIEERWTGSSINPCLNASYWFAETVLRSLKSLYDGIDPLDMVHIGADEVLTGIWDDSPACKKLFKGRGFDHDGLKKSFTLSLINTANKLGMKVFIREDGIYDKGKGVFNHSKSLKPADVFVTAWNNVWELGNGVRAVEIADAGYTVVLALATHLYFDNPYEPDPEEPGLFWTTRYIDTHKTFGLIPMNIFANADFNRTGFKVDHAKLCHGRCPTFKKHENVAGIEASIWTTLIRTEEQLHNMLFPRLLALAERAWHKADWEDIEDKEKREPLKEKDWQNFVQILGTKELPRLDKDGIKYRIPPPGMAFYEATRTLILNTLYPNHDIMISFGSPNNWQAANNSVQVPVGVRFVHAKTLSPVQKRSSRVLHLNVPSSSSLFSYKTNFIWFYVNTICTFLYIVMSH